MKELKESINEVMFFSDSTKYEKFLLIIMHLLGSLWLIPILAMASNTTKTQSMGLYAFIGCVVAFIITYCAFKFAVQKRTKQKVSILFNPSFRWGGKKY